jgi:hypothetical protein
MRYFDLVAVIGTGPAGQKAAIQAAKLGKRVAIIERGSVLGGAALPVHRESAGERVLCFARGEDPLPNPLPAYREGERGRTSDCATFSEQSASNAWRKTAVDE